MYWLSVHRSLMSEINLREKILLIAKRLPVPYDWQLERRRQADYPSHIELGQLLQTSPEQVESFGADVIVCAEREEMPQVLVRYMMRCTMPELHLRSSDIHTDYLIRACTYDGRIPKGDFLRLFGECPVDQMLLLSKCLHLIGERYANKYSPAIDDCLVSFWSQFQNLCGG